MLSEDIKIEPVEEVAIEDPAISKMQEELAAEPSAKKFELPAFMKKLFKK